jgi:hypothetical protein
MVIRAHFKLRSRRRQQRGATVFVVVLAVTLLTAIGLFAAHSATLVDQAAGYERMARQTQQIAEFGTLATTAELGSGTAESHVAQLYATGKTCTANAGREDARCYKRTYADINNRTQELSDESLTRNAVGDKEDVLGNGTVEGDFVVELTDPSDNVRVPGSDYGSSSTVKYRYVQVTATTIAQVRPAGAVACTNDVATLTGQQTMRAHLVVGPVPLSN